MLKTDAKNIFETGKPHLDKTNTINYDLVVTIQHDPGELRGLKSWTFAKFELSL
jgi:hypothetical protein